MLILLVAAAASAAELHAGLGVGLLAWQTSARHAITPVASPWLTVTDRPWALTVEAIAARRVDEAEDYRFRTVHLRAAVVPSFAIGSHATSLLVGLGPALTARNTAVELEDRTVSWRLDPGLRARLALEGPLGEHVAFAWHVGLVTRGGGADWDSAIGLGYRR